MLAEPLATLLHRCLTENTQVKADLIVPVPIHGIKRRLRGYNQSELLATALSRLISRPVSAKCVRRRQYTSAQVELSRSERWTNVRNAFEVVAPEEISGRNLLLVDDVATTCSTVHECSLALLKAGAGKVSVLCLAFDE
jgi:competence protein ComFC